jgi:hypothetical protein
VNKSGSNTVCMVVAVILILAASASATPVQPVSTLLACTAAQLSLAFDGESVESTGRSQSGTLRPHRSFQLYAATRRPSRHFRAGSNPGLHLEAATSRFHSPAFVALSFKSDTLHSSFETRDSTSSGQDAGYRFDYLKRDLVYVRFKA